MKALSIWQPWASLIISGHKRIETRSWPPPYSIRGQRIAIASTKDLRREQRLALSEVTFRIHYAGTGLPTVDNLPMGCVLGTVCVEDCREIDTAFLQDLDTQEEAFGWYGPGRFAWLLTEPVPLAAAISVKGGQGLWNWKAEEGRTDVLWRA